MKTLLLHHFEPYWEHSLLKYDTSFEQEVEKVIDYIEYNKNNIEKVIITLFEDLELSIEHNSILNICNENNIDIEHLNYGYGWTKDEISTLQDFSEQNINKTWCQGTRDYHDDDDIILIEDWMHNLKEKEVVLCGAFEGECIRDIEAAFDSINVNYEKYSPLIVGSFEEYIFKNIKANELFSIINHLEYIGKEKIDEIHTIETNNQIDYFLFLELENSLFEIEEHFNFHKNQYNEFKEKIVSFVQENTNFEKKDIELIMDIENKISEFNNLRKDIYLQHFTETNIESIFFHGTKEDINDNITKLNTEYSDEKAIYLSNSINVAKHFSKTVNSTGNPIVFSTTIKNNKTFIYNEYIEDELGFSPEERTELYQYLKDKGYHSFTTKNNYGTNEDDIAYFYNIENLKKEIIHKNNNWIKYPTTNKIKMK